MTSNKDDFAALKALYCKNMAPA